MKAYPKYKPSNIEWMGEIPEHWGITELKRLCLKVTDGSHFSPETQNKGLPYITVKDIKENHIDFENCKRISEEDYYKLKKNGCQPNRCDVLLTKDGTIGKAVVINEDKDFVILSSLGLITPNQSKVTSEYLRYYLISGVNIDQMFSFIHGSALTRLTITLINQLLIVSPTIKEQQSITRYLKDRTKKIDALIEKKQKLINLLKEERTAIINQAAIKGLNPDVPMKDSGIEWLGEIPKHWEVKKLKNVVKGKLKYGANESAELEDVFFPRYIRITDFGDDGKLRDDTFKSLPFEIANEYLLEKGDILFARSGATVGKTFQFKNYQGLACFAGYLIKASPDENKILSDFLYLFTKSNVYENWKNSIYIQATIQNIGADKYNLLQITAPPIEEQESIVELIECESTKIDHTISRIEKEITLLQEYRTALISEVVTGKIDVREAI